jgi:hypothetical protein
MKKKVSAKNERKLRSGRAGLQKCGEEDNSWILEVI